MVEGDATDALQRLGRLGMYPMLAAARAQAEVHVTYCRTDEGLRAHRPDELTDTNAGISEYWREDA